ncbi:hypothetical protein LJC23_06910 [Desulfovibrio sp. OttesenSCG-928-I05]|nr:hypothetical protein [Desulfovibrio sp. OttesenSCG-928-I05]
MQDAPSSFWADPTGLLALSELLGLLENDLTLITDTLEELALAASDKKQKLKLASASAALERAKLSAKVIGSHCSPGGIIWH